MTHDEQVQVILEDMKGKIHRRDWHGVADCAMDLRELDALERGRQEVRNDQARKTAAVYPQDLGTADGKGQVHVGGVPDVRQGWAQETLPGPGVDQLGRALGQPTST